MQTIYIATTDLSRMQGSHKCNSKNP